MSLDPWLWSNVFVSDIARLLPCGETRQQKGLNLAYWPWRFRNGLHIASKNDSSLGESSHNTNRKTKPLGAAHGVRSLPGADHVLGL